MRHATDILEAAAEIIVTMVLMAFIFWGLRGGLQAVREVSQEVDANITALAQSGITKYDGAKVSGSDVINAVARYSVDTAITVKNAVTRTYGIGGDKFRAADNVVGAEGYIDPFALYTGEVLYNDNGILAGLSFKIIN